MTEQQSEYTVNVSKKRHRARRDDGTIQIRVDAEERRAFDRVAKSMDMYCSAMVRALVFARDARNKEVSVILEALREFEKEKQNGHNTIHN
jgi:antitoxin component of RelBE/YafQ-DinJ toxin-antitoxin module